jgi:hypothetical protein
MMHHMLFYVDMWPMENVLVRWSSKKYNTCFVETFGAQPIV